MAGIKNILTKSYGSTNPVNLVKATLLALSRLRTEREVGDLREVELRAPAPAADAAPAAAALGVGRS